ncbi:uncharacterized protein LOC121917795 [Sceloporus undulatus]|uniref:uncharacterized protein LOC121917795 n=1 Tax=Sceloporus undulatus TaxID=8520 RepID=UPI001C4B9934|nr:uncharacterized protein LOC121917795 [Sceloporus undulatus]
MEQNLAREIKNLRADFKKDLKSELRDFRQTLESVTKELKQVNIRVQKLEEKANSMEDIVKKVKSDQELEKERLLDMRALEEQKARQNCLKLRGVKENKGENLYDLLIPILADYMNIPVQEVSWSINKIYRINSKIAKEKSLPRDIVIYFLRQNVKDHLLQTSYQDKLIIEECEIRIFKDVPKRILQRREGYKFLTTQLNRHNILYKWEKLEGISVYFKQRWTKINSVFKANEFWKRHGKEIEITREPHDDKREEEQKGLKEDQIDHKDGKDEKQDEQDRDSNRSGSKEDCEEEESDLSELDEEEVDPKKQKGEEEKSPSLDTSLEEGKKAKPRRKRCKNKAK